MTPTEFKARFEKAQGPVPDDIDLDLAKFRAFPEERIAALEIDAPSKRILREVGFPEDAAPFLSFREKADKVLRKLPSAFSFLGQEFARYRLLGSNGSGDFICIDESDGSIVYLNHDSDMKRVFINSSLVQFAESLCLIAEALQSGYATDFIGELSRIDPAAVGERVMWPVEYAMMKE
jgi:hypothetical protein